MVATLNLSLWGSQAAALEGRDEIPVLPKKRPFLPGDFEAKRKAVFSPLLHLPSISPERKDKRGFPFKGLRNLGTGPRDLGREEGFPEQSSSDGGTCCRAIFMRLK